MIEKDDGGPSDTAGCAWLIETARGTYWDGRKVGPDAWFTSDPLEACRFVREEDAEKVRCWLLEPKTGGQFLRSVQHRFMTLHHADAMLQERRK